MFSVEYNGYNKSEVDEFISELKAEHERALMEEKLKVLETEKKMLDLKKKNSDVEKREKNILAVLESFKKLQSEGNRNIEFLRGKQLKMVYIHLQDFLQELNVKYPGILINNSYKKLMNDIENILANTEAKEKESVGAGTENDPMRILLSKMKDKKVQENPKEVKIERVEKPLNKVYESPSQIKPVCEMKLEDNDDYDNLVDKFLNTRPEENETPKIEIQSTGFDLKEAINPKDDLDEIMKAFDFYASDSNKPNSDDYDF